MIYLKLMTNSNVYYGIEIVMLEIWVLESSVCIYITIILVSNSYIAFEYRIVRLCSD
jgi:hypothetical protein